ncbi:bZIP transcription factor 53-like [Vigna unguiculata]|uniref:Extracellular signal-regulated kinase 1/2 n=1 Tax=Vigna unguiculata TaxID=3917 RepID=A0A4D6LR45_VIGUN|nr:bZIP transcription factor 53-like [Vigna unguiculata]QCD91429.1 extracellular signal-regulated kinase 1/2 [Vigna unguiculata]
MLSALPSSDSLLGNAFPAFDYALGPWDGPEFFSFKPTSPNPVTSSSASDDPNPTPADQKPASDQSNRVVSLTEERKRRRMISNRDSARRSRMRKQRHLENLRNQTNLFRVENRELNNGFQFLLHHCNRLRTENEWLRSERTLLRQKLADINQILLFRQLQPFSTAWPCNIVMAE